jgi:hypothetical protein
MTNVSLENIKGNAIGGLIAALVMAAVPSGKLTEFFGQSLATLLLIVIAAAMWAVVIVYHRYVQVLSAGGSRIETPARQTYDRLRASLGNGGPVAQLYSDRLRRSLDAVDRFFGDSEFLERTLFHHIFWLKTPAPLWTAPALDRCVLLAMVYPITTVFLMWAISGHVGPAEKSLLLNSEIEWWKRAFAVLAMVSAIFAGLSGRGKDWTKNQATYLVIGICLSIGFGLGGAGAFGGSFFNSNALSVAAVALALLAVVFTAEFSELDGVFSLSVAFWITLMVSYPPTPIRMIMYAVGCIIFFGGLLLLNRSEIWRNRRGLILSLFMIAMTLVCLIDAHQMSLYTLHRPQGASLLLFVIFLTLINAPFDWFSLGLTRALLRRGLELSGWWPLVLAITDAIAGTIIVVVALTMVIGVQGFDGLIVHGGGNPTLPLDALLDDIIEHPTEPEYWWIYSLLLSTMIPSLINLAIGGASLMRGIPGVSSWLLSKMPIGRSVPKLDRSSVALVLTLQFTLGVMLGGAAQAFLAWIVFFKAMPVVGLGLLDMTRKVAAFDLPERVGQLFGG